MKKYKIKYGENSFPASSYQCEIFDNVEHGSGNMVINAAAGAAKSTTIINCIGIIKPKKKILFIAFNKEIVQSISAKVGKRENIKISTFHSLGFSIIRDNIRSNIIDKEDFINEFKYRNYIKTNIDNITSFKETKSLSKNRTSYINNIINLVEYSRYYLAFSKKEIKRIANKYGLILYRDEVSVVKDVLKWGKENTDQIDFTDMIWLPNVLNFESKKNKFDWILIDEAQDTSIAEQKLIEKCFKRGTRFAAVCDTFQQINIWAGSSDEAIENFKHFPNTKEFKLPITYRCPKKVVELAKKYSDNIIAKEDAIDGEINDNVSKFAPKENDMVLCRITAPLIQLHLDYIRINKKSYVKGYDNIKEQYLNLINGVKNKTSDIIDAECNSFNGLFPELYRKLIKQISTVKELYELDDEDALQHQSVLNLYDNIIALNVISEGLNTVEELVDKINIIFDGDSNNAVQLSTVHKAKGLESDNVFILNPSLMPSKYAKKDWQIRTEKNLIYVAYTRAKKTLNFIEEPEHGRFHGQYQFDPEYMKAFLKDIKKKLSINEKESIIKRLTPTKKLNTENMKAEKKDTNTSTTRNKKRATTKLAGILR